MTTISNALQAVRTRISKALADCGRAEDEVLLLAVTKQVTASSIRLMQNLGLHAFGESYVQEALGKIEALADLPLCWHFIGPIQSNKTKLIAAHFAWVHSVSSVKLAQRLSDQRDASAPPLNLCLQVNSSGEASKSGVRPDDALALARAVATLPNLKLRGLMTIPEPSADSARQRARFRQMRELRDDLNRHGFAMDTLSMGMSADLESAIAEGATIVRIGSAIFGARDLRPGDVAGGY